MLQMDQLLMTNWFCLAAGQNVADGALKSTFLQVMRTTRKALCSKRDETSLPPVVRRMRWVVGEQPVSQVAREVNAHPETFRRYLLGTLPPVDVLERFARQHNLSLDWLLRGEGPIRATAMEHHYLSHASFEALLLAVAARLKDLCDRVDLLEVRVVSLSTEVGVGVPTQASTLSVTTPMPCNDGESVPCLTRAPSTVEHHVHGSEPADLLSVGVDVRRASRTGQPAA
jgi:hypothetical protein